MSIEPRILAGIGLGLLLLALVLVVTAMRRPSRVVNMVDALEKHPSKRYGSRDMAHVNEITIHHTAGSQGPEEVARLHVYDNDWPGIGYHYMIDPNGVVFQTNEDRTLSYHNSQTNTTSLGIALIGNFELHEPTASQYRALKSLIRKLQASYPGITNIIPHHYHKATACPGRYLDMNRIIESA
jgi:N-acetyl-anhydromuramyl-L-alanine amidase AmpD